MEYNGITLTEEEAIMKIGDDSFNEETIFEFIVRAQLVTSNAKQDTYFAKDPVFGYCFVKGPYKNYNSIKRVRDIYLWKKENGLLPVDYYIVELYPTRWPDGTPLGTRNSCIRTKRYPFMVTKSLLKNDNPATRMHSSAKWPETEVLESDKTWDPVKMWKEVGNDVKLDYIFAILCRSMFGSKDNADRNFVYFNNNIYSIDEDGESTEFYNPFDALTSTKKGLVTSFVSRYLKLVVDNVSSWSDYNGQKEHLLKTFDVFTDEYKDKLYKSTLKNIVTCGYRQSLSSHGHEKASLISAMHKYVRRCEVKKLAYVFGQLFSFFGADLSSQRKATITNFANRLIITAIEDAGTCFDIYYYVYSVYLMITELNSSNQDITIEQADKVAHALCNVADTLGSCKKARIASCFSQMSRYFENYTEYRKHGIESSIIDIITNVYNESKDSDLKNLFYEYIAKKSTKSYVLYKYLWDKGILGKDFLIFMESELSVKDELLQKLHSILKSHNEEFMVGAVALFVYISGKDVIEYNSSQNLLKYFNIEYKCDLDDYVYDKHVSSRHGDLKKFVEEGSFVENHSDIEMAHEMTDFYNKTRLIEIENTNNKVPVVCETVNSSKDATCSKCDCKAKYIFNNIIYCGRHIGGLKKSADML